ncbi:type IV pilus assembly protein PilO [Arenicella xantha]|uniref:Type IV pilus assembly protein PilO n=2 Tax=Arenicella xantha TaxID=644221 RepID=A0A395JGH6_9GAMM|nr:type IV pilus assembly protein PilO [Arenicella xantha]
MGLLEELNGLDFNDIGSWTRRVKLLMAGILCVAIIVAGYNFIIKDQITALQKVQKLEPQLKQTFLEKKALAINLDAYKQQMIEADENFSVLRKQLPNESEMPDLLIDMTQVGLSRGLQFEQIKPGSLIEKDFYAEKLVNISANGRYHQIAEFISDVAALPRIINVADFTLERRGDDPEILSLRAVTKTYHYLEDAYVSE